MMRPPSFLERGTAAAPILRASALESAASAAWVCELETIGLRLSFARFGAGEAGEEPEVIWFRSGLPNGMHNGVAWCAPTLSEATVDRVLERFADLPIRWMCPPSGALGDAASRLASRGFKQPDAMALMTVALGSLREEPLPARVVVEEVRTVEQLQAWAALATPDPTRVESNTRMHVPLLTRSPEHHRYYLASLDGRLVARSMLRTLDGVAGIYGVFTEPELRGRGLGRALTLLPLLHARARGYEVGALQASELGEPVYRKLGFARVGSVDDYWRTTASAQALAG